MKVRLLSQSLFLLQDLRHSLTYLHPRLSVKTLRRYQVLSLRPRPSPVSGVSCLVVHSPKPSTSAPRDLLLDPDSLLSLSLLGNVDDLFCDNVCNVYNRLTFVKGETEESGRVDGRSSVNNNHGNQLGLGDGGEPLTGLNEATQLIVEDFTVGSVSCNLMHLTRVLSLLLSSY